MPDLTGIEFVQTLGQGAMGAVYLARQTSLNRYVAAKQILGAWNGDPEILARFQREARALAQMNHPNVVGIFDLTTSGNDIFMIMEYVRGPSLRQLMDRGRLTVAQGLRAVGDVAAALDYASRIGIIHRDLKPGNVFITITGTCKLGDFGLVKMLSGQAIFQTTAGTILGTPAYMSPEQAAGKPDIDQRSDVYSLTVMTYELLVGRLPFPSIPGNIMASLDAHISQPPPKPSDLVPGFPKPVEEVLLEGLAKDPKRRPASAAEYWHKLNAAATRAWPTWEHTSDLAAIALEAAPPAPPTPERPTLPPMVVTTPGSIPPAPEPEALPADTEPPMPEPEIQAPVSEPAVAAAASALPEETVVQPPAAPEETVLQPPGAPDETVVHGATSPDETVVEPPERSPSIVVPLAPPAPPTQAPPPPPVVPAAGGAPGPVAAGGAAAAPSAAFTLIPPPARVDTPVYQPPPPTQVKRKGGAGRWMLILLIVLAILLIGAGAFAYLGGSQLFGPKTPVAIQSVSISVDKDTGHCPSATYVFTGHIKTNGSAGDVTFQWVKPDGTTSSPSVVSVKKDEKDAVATLQFTFQGNGSTAGDAALKVLKPSDVSSQRVHVTYTCP